MSACRLCAGPAETFISLGRMPIANGFLAPEEFGAEYFYDLAAMFCERCRMPQLVEVVDPARLFDERYPFFTASSSAMTRHFARFAAVVRERWLGDGALVVEVGSNDGTMLANFASRGIRHLGVEPSANVARQASACGVETRVSFFDATAVDEILRAAGPADAVIAANCFCHIPDLHALARELERLLAPRGVVVFEDPYLPDIVEQVAYDQVYDEHVYYFSLGNVTRWLEPHGFEVIAAEAQPVHGGSMRYTFARRGAHPVGESVAAVRRGEEGRGLDRTQTFVRFRERVEKSRDDLVAMLRDARRGGKRVAGYAATSKSTTVLNYCGIGPDLVECVSDTTPAKQGKYTPGTHIPVRPHAHFAARYPDYALLFAWNHMAEIRAKEQAFAAAGGRWIVYVPEVRSLD